MSTKTKTNNTPTTIKATVALITQLFNQAHSSITLHFRRICSALRGAHHHDVR